MEYEILNSILTNTVASLFPNKTKHLKFFQTNTDRSTNVEIPKSSNRKSGNINSTTNFSSNITNAIETDNSLGKENSIESWYLNSKKRLDQVLKKLNLNEIKTSVKYLATLSLEQIEVEKSKIKKELQEIDKEFEKLFKRQPTKTEKEVLRPLYVYYNDLKQVITKKTGEKLSNKNSRGSSKNSDIGIVNSEKKENMDLVAKEKKVTKEKDSYKEKQKEVDMNFKESKRPQSSQVNKKNNEKYKDKENQPKALSTNNNGDMELLNDKMSKARPSTAKNKAYENFELEDLKKELQRLKTDQVNYKQKLHEYQKDFLLKNNRRVKYYRDIEEVQFEYVSYKENRFLIRDIEEIILAKMSKLQAKAA